MRNLSPLRNSSSLSFFSVPRRLAPLLALPLLVGCKTECQKLCQDMADYADECGLTISDEDLDACLQANSRKATSEEQRAECEANRPNLKEEWTCEEVEENLLEQGDAAAGGGDGATDDTGA